MTESNNNEVIPGILERGYPISKNQIEINIPNGFPG
jgi:hypothetical protein